MIEFKNVSFAYGHRSQIINDLSLEFSEGHIHGLLGCNGTGKTTMLKLASGLLFPRSGEVSVDGFNPSKRSPRLFSEMILVPEEFDLPAVGCETFARYSSAFYPQFSFSDFEHYCNELAVDRTMKLTSMSMGQRKKAYIAFAMAARVRILVMDEPTNGLDIPSKASLRRLLAAYASSERTVVISTHQVRDLENLIDNVVIVDRKGVILNASTDEISRRLFFGECAEPRAAIYSEKSLEGTLCVASNTDGRDSRINLELLFDAATEARQTICEMFNK